METILVNVGGRVRRVTRNGRHYLVAPATLIVPGVLNGSRGALFYPPEEVARSADAWNDTPIVVYHPTKNGGHVSGRSPDVLDAAKVGRVYNAGLTKGRLAAEAWFDVERTRAVDPRVLDALLSGTPIELSTGLFTSNEPAPPGAEYNGRPYDWVARDYRPDHLAVLPDQTGACSLRDGCGVLATNRAHPSFSDSAWPAYSAPLLVANAEDGGVPSDDLDMTPEKACEILEDGEVHGKPLTEEQRGMFGAKCGQRAKTDNWAGLPARPEGTAMPLTAQQRSALIGHLTANCDCWKHPGDRDLLSGMGDDKLLQLKAAAEQEQKAIDVANAAVRGFADGRGNAFRINPETGRWEHRAVANANAPKPRAVDPDEDEGDGNGGEGGGGDEGKKRPARNQASARPAPPRKPQTFDDLVRSAPPEVQNRLQQLQQIEQQQKDQLIEQLLANTQPAERRVRQEYFQRYELNDLRNILAVMPKPAAGDDAPPAANRRRPPQQHDDDVLGVPQMDWQPVGNDKREEPPAPAPAADAPWSPDEPTEEEVINSLPARYRRRWQEVVASEAAERRELVRALTANLSSEEAEARLDWLEGLPLSRLRSLTALAPRKEPSRPPNYFGSSVPAANAARPPDFDDILPVPSMDWADDDEPRRRQA